MSTHIKPTKKNRRKRPIPLAPPAAMRSRKKARRVTTLFHKYIHERDRSLALGDYENVRRCDEDIEKIGGREEYQRASRLSTSFHSTSGWVLGVLGGVGWLHGIPISQHSPEDAAQRERDGEGMKKRKRRRKVRKRTTRLLEVGAINTELLDASKKKARVKISSSGEEGTLEYQHVYRLDVRAIDLRSSHEEIEEADFLKLPLVHDDVAMRYDVCVCSMVINCVSAPEDRGRMLTLLYHQLRPGGLCFLTLPRLCLNQSKYTTAKLFEEMLTRDGGGVGFDVVKRKESPKVAFFVLQRPVGDEEEEKRSLRFNPKWKKVVTINNGRKYRNDFAVSLKEEDISGHGLLSCS